MTLQHFLGIWQVETIKLFSRTTARAGLVIAILIGLLGPMLLWWAGNSEFVINGASLAENIQSKAPHGLIWAIEMRNKPFILRVFVITLAALSFAGEYKAHTIREDVIRPIPRWTIPMAKWLALNTWIASTILAAWVFGGLLGILVFGFSGEWLRAAEAYGATFLADAGFAALVFLVAIASRSVAGTIAGVFIFMVLDTLTGWALWALSKLAVFLELPGPLEYAVSLQPWLPSSAFGVWTGYGLDNEWA